MEKVPSPEIREIYDIKTLSAQSKMKYLLEIFNLGKDEEKNEERKKNFIELISKYHRAYIKSTLNISNKKDGERYEEGRAKLHNEIMEIIKNMSLSLGLTQEQREVASYLSEHRDEVTQMISSYFTLINPNTVDSPSEYSKMKEQLDALSNKTGPEEE